MKTYECTLIYDASTSCTAIAASADEAAEAALNQCEGVTLCHHCASQLDVGDVSGVFVYDGDTLVVDTTFAGEQVAVANARLESLQTSHDIKAANLQALVRAVLEYAEACSRCEEGGNDGGDIADAMDAFGAMADLARSLEDKA